MATTDAFNSNIFGMISLTAAVNKAPYKPRLLASLGLFEEKPITTKTAFVEEKLGKLSILNTAARGTRNNVRQSDQRKARSLIVPHVPYFQSIFADDIQDIRGFGMESDTEALAKYVNDQLIGMRDDHEVTHEYHRLGAIKGIIYDGDASTVIYNLFTEFGVSQTTHSWKSTDSTFASSCTSIVRSIAGKLGSTMFNGIIALCGNDYFDAIVSHSSVRADYDRWRDGEWRRMLHLGSEWYALATQGFDYQNIFFLNYRGQIGDVTFVADNEAYYIPRGVPGLFQEILAPANFNETVNTRGLRLYAKQRVMDFDVGIELHTQSNMLPICTRPAAIVKSTWSAS